VTSSGVTTGIDLVDCARIARLLREDSTFLNLTFTAVEQEYCQKDPARLGARWAAKESAMKALGQGVGKIAPLDIEVSRDENGAPTMKLSGSAIARAQELGITDWSVSLSHESGFAMAFVVMTKGGRDV
jgi:phosphopantetheine--protein transferase-like protein